MADPAPVETVIGPLFAFAGTVTVIESPALSTETFAPTTPPENVTVGEAKLLPEIVNVVPTAPFIGETLAIVGPAKAPLRAARPVLETSSATGISIPARKPIRRQF
jgi:hypothetical protein